jgi:serine phosphatase RsbU (regulator of sigma subunit)
VLDEPPPALLSSSDGSSPDRSTRNGDRALVDLALRLGELSQRDTILRAGAAALASALALPAAWSRDVPRESARGTSVGTGAGRETAAAIWMTAREPAAPVVYTDHERLRAHFPTLAVRLPRSGFDAWVVARLAVDGAPAGALGVAWAAEQPMDDGTHRLLTVVGRLVSLRLRLMEARAREHEVAQRLQLSLLPVVAPVEGLEIECRYHPAGANALAGGDFYDVVDLEPGLTAILIGDVAGHGVDAAAASGEVRYLVRGMLEHTRDPARVLELVERALGRGRRRITMVTLLCAVIDAEREELRMASAGHGPPIIRRPGGETTLAPIEPAPPLGAGLVLASMPSITAVPFHRGELAVFYTDGLVERRSTPIDEVLDEVLGIVAEHDSAATICSLLEHLALTPHSQRDDVALLVVRSASAEPDGHADGAADVTVPDVDGVRVRPQRV